MEPSGSLLVVDDSSANRAALAKLLAREGCNVVTAHGGRRALEIIDTVPVDLVLLDIMMQDMNGIDVLRAIRRSRSPTDLPVIMATAKDGSEDIVQALQLGANDYVTKPLDLPVLLARVQTQLSLKAAVNRVFRLEQSLARRNEELELANAKLTDANGLMRQDLEAAARIQQAFLPPTPLRFPGLDIAWLFKPCTRLAGDTLNAFRIDSNHVALYVLDVSGHGVAAALLAVTLSHVLSPRPHPSTVVMRPTSDGTAYEPASPGEVARQLNQRFTLDARTEQYFTIVYGLLNISTGEFRYVHAGHPGPVHVRPEGAAEMYDAPSLPIGFSAGDYQERRLRLEPGDRLYLYSDGLYDAMDANHQLFGKERLRESFERHRREPLEVSAQAVWKEVDDWCAAESIKDDMSILAVEFIGPPAPTLRTPERSQALGV